MKSKKAEEIIDSAWTSVANTVWKDDAIRAVEIAEQEAEERIKNKAIESYKSICKTRQSRNDPYHGCEYNCDSCGRVKEFTNELNK